MALSRLVARGGAAIWCAPSREGVGVPADDAFVIENGRLMPC